MDEPIASLDPGGVRVVEEMIRRFRDQGRLVLVSTHQMDFAERIADRVCVLQDGRLVFEGCVRELRTQHGSGSDETLETLFLRVTNGVDHRAAGVRLGRLPPAAFGKQDSRQ